MKSKNGSGSQLKNAAPAVLTLPLPLTGSEVLALTLIVAFVAYALIGPNF
ncbi:MAG: hypothetical protein IK114_14375 [Fibrobacter sp.]|nr:hypothetical protein [Fibrobacter sp.]